VKFFLPLLHFLFTIGYFGPFLMGVLDSSFLVLPFGNDLLVVGLVAQHHHLVWLYVLAAACGSTVGVLALALVSRKLGEEGIRKLAGQKKYERLKKRVGTHSGIAIAIGCLAPPPFPFTMVIAASAALGYSLWRLLAINFLARAARFTLLAWLALKFGHQVLAIAKSDPFKWSMGIFILLCLAGSAFSIWNWLRKSRSQDKQEKQAR
jgi:membrane protein YqaA with SNARE-associated domain